MLISEILQHFFEPKSDIVVQLNDINLPYVKAHGIEKYRTTPEKGHEFEIIPHPHQDGVYKVSCSYYGTFYMTLNTDNLVEDLSLQLQTRPNIVHKFNANFKRS